MFHCSSPKEEYSWFYLSLCFPPFALVYYSWIETWNKRREKHYEAVLKVIFLIKSCDETSDYWSLGPTRKYRSPQGRHLWLVSPLFETQRVDLSLHCSGRVEDQKIEKRPIFFPNEKWLWLIFCHLKGIEKKSAKWKMCLKYYHVCRKSCW